MRLYRNNLDSIPLLPYALLYTAGILLVAVCSSLWIWIALFAVIVSLVIAKRVILASWVATLLLGIIASHLSTPTENYVQNLLSQNVFSGYVLSAQENDNGTTAIIRLSDIMPGTGRAKIKIIVPSFDTGIYAGMDVCIQGHLSDQYATPDLPYEIDYATNDKRDGIVARGYILPDSILSITPSASIEGRFALLRDKFKQFILRSPFSSQLKEFLVAILLGDTTLISTDLRQTFSQAGLSHIIAISGMHIAIITMLLSLALWPMLMCGIGRWRPIPIIIFLWGYATFTGFAPSVTRSVIMATVYFIGRMTERRASPYNSLCFAALIILIVDPQELYNVGFQLSFAAVLSILLFSEELNPVNPRKRLPYIMAGYITVCISAVLGTFAVSAFYFHTIPLSFLPANLICALAFPILLGCAMVGLLLFGLGLDIHLFYSISEYLYNTIIDSAEWLLRGGPAPIQKIYISAWCLIPYGLAIGAFKMWLMKRSFIWASTMALSVTSIFVIGLITSSPRCTPHIYASRSGLHTDMIIDGGDGVLRVITTAPTQPQWGLHNIKTKYRDFMGRQNIDSVQIIGDEAGEYGPMLINHQIVSFPTFTMAIIPSTPLQSKHVNYAVLCRGFTSSVDEVAEYYQPDTIILSKDLHPKTLRRLSEDCQRKGIPCISLRNQPWSRAL